MKKYLISLLIIVWFFLQLSFVLALSTEQKWAILERFQNKQYDLLFESNLSSFSDEYSDIFDISKKIDLYESLSEDIKIDKLEAEEQNNDLISKITTLEESIIILDNDIADTANNIKNININIIDIKKEVEANTRTIEILNKKIAENRELLLDYLVYIYKKWNTAYEWLEIDNLKSILLNNEDISDLINDLYYNWLVQVAWKELIDNHREFVSSLYLKKIDLENQEVTLKSLRKQWIIEQKILSDKKEFKERILEWSKWKQAFYEQYLEKKVELENQVRVDSIKEKIKLNVLRDSILEKYWCEYVDLSQNTAETRALESSWSKCYWINRMILSEWKLIDSDNLTDSGNVLSWPVDPILWISAYFADEDYIENIWTKHNAIDVRTAQWTPIMAPMDWYVVYLKAPDSEDYAYVALKHYDWYLTVYWHVSEILVDKFDYVEKWEVFARTGWEYWTAWAWYLTTWPHLHFEVFKDEEYIDPLNVLDLSYIKFQKIPEQYQKKYYADFELKNWYSYVDPDSNGKRFSLEWTNEIERQKYLISTYAVWAFNNWQLWIDESLDWNIDPSLVMCIGLAETTLWKNVSTPYNIWNVGNNDRWDRVWYPNARAWVYAIIYTLNNRYFRDTNSLAELSWAWRKLLGLPWCPVVWEFCYATDTDHWHDNVTKCLTHLKWAYVPDTYNFRLIK